MTEDSFSNRDRNQTMDTDMTTTQDDIWSSGAGNKSLGISRKSPRNTTLEGKIVKPTNTGPYSKDNRNKNTASPKSGSPTKLVQKHQHPNSSQKPPRDDVVVPQPSNNPTITDNTHKNGHETQTKDSHGEGNDTGKTSVKQPQDTTKGEKTDNKTGPKAKSTVEKTTQKMKKESNPSAKGKSNATNDTKNANEEDGLPKKRKARKRTLTHYTKTMKSIFYNKFLLAPVVTSAISDIALKKIIEVHELAQYLSVQNGNTTLLPQEVNRASRVLLPPYYMEEQTDDALPKFSRAYFKEKKPTGKQTGQSETTHN